MGGYRVKNLESFNPEYICPCCLLLLRDPVQIIICGHRICQPCADEEKGDVIFCSKCCEKALRNNLILDRGFKNDMRTLSIICFFCDWTDILKNYQDHLDQVHPNPKCIYCGEYLSTVNELNRHQQYVCEKMQVNCPFKQFGCEEMVLRVNLSEHYRSKQHQNVLLDIVLHLKSINRSAHADSSNITENTAIQLEEIDQTMNVLSDGVVVLKEDEQRLRTEATNYQQTLDSLVKNLPKLKKSIEEQNAFLDEIKRNQDILPQELEAMKQKINDMKTRSYDGTFLWKITDVPEKFAAARSDTQTSIYSPPFYSSSTGYKMCLRLYLDGDGHARKTHMSLFIVLMRSEYDAILKFPFDFKVIFCLFDQVKQQNHIIDAFRPDTHSNSFQRPRSEMNIGSGIPKFAPVKIFQQENNPYIRDDTMFIKVLVDFDNIPAHILPYAFSLNPGLTRPIQQGLIQLEGERRQQQSSNSMAKTETNQSLVNLSQVTSDSIDRIEK